MRYDTRFKTLLPLFGFLALTACGGSDAPAVEDVAVEQAAEAPLVNGLELAQFLQVSNAREPLPNLVTAGQLTEAQFQAMVDAGFEHFISLRLATENGAGWEEEYAAETATDFQRLPVAGAEQLSMESVQALDALLKEADGQPTVLYCGSSNRVGALMALRAYWLQGASAEDAMALGEAAGMTRLQPAVAAIINGEG
jgi:protein tyrosine phosphatase (PTP) superfamily phosphohydrolase (DUF442 family)